MSRSKTANNSPAAQQARKLFKELSGKGMGRMHATDAVRKRLSEATPEKQKQRLARLEKVTERFVKVCEEVLPPSAALERAKELRMKTQPATLYLPPYERQAYAKTMATDCTRYARGNRSLGMLDKLAAPMPLGFGAQPVRFHNARWAYHFARNEVQLHDAGNQQRAQMLAGLRQEQAKLLRNVRKLERMQKAGGVLSAYNTLSYDRMRVKENAKLLKPFEAERAAKRNAALAKVKEAERPSNVIRLRVKRPAVQPQALRA